MKFTVIMAVYINDNHIFVKEAINSILQQTRKPDEFLIVADGIISNELRDLLQAFEARGDVTLIFLKENTGAGPARDVAIRQAAHEVVAIMDADDICVPERFEKQLPIIEDNKADIVGSWIEEFNDEAGDLNRLRSVPVMHDEIYRYGKWRQPLNHVTAVFKKSAYIASGGYKPVRLVEDYDLLVRMLVSGCVFHNLPEVLVYVRSGTSVLTRRRGIAYMTAEFTLYKNMLYMGYLNVFQFVGGVIIRVTSRLIPRLVLSLMYEKILRTEKKKAYN